MRCKTVQQRNPVSNFARGPQPSLSSSKLNPVLVDFPSRPWPKQSLIHRNTVVNDSSSNLPVARVYQSESESNEIHSSMNQFAQAESSRNEISPRLQRPTALAGPRVYHPSSLKFCNKGMSCPNWQCHRTGSRWFPVRTLPVAPLWCDLGFFPNSRGNKAAANLRPNHRNSSLPVYHS